MSDEATERRVRFYGVGDRATPWQADRALQIAERFGESATSPASVTDVIELHNVAQFLEAGVIPIAYTEAERDRVLGHLPRIRGFVAKYFAQINSANAAQIITGVDYEYHADLLELLGRSGAFEGCDPAVMLAALGQADVHLGEMLASKSLVNAYDDSVRQLLMGEVRNAEHLIRRYLQMDSSDQVHLPRSLAPADVRDLLQRYIESADANPNYVALIATAKVNAQVGIDAKLKLLAKRRKARMNEEFFKDNAGIKTGCEVSISESQEKPVVVEMDEMVARFTYGLGWLEATLDYPSILNNFQHLFEFADRQVLLTLPAYPANMGVVERFLTTTGKTDYKMGAAFNVMEWSSLLQTRLYHHFLGAREIDLEAVVSWFFETYLVEEFGATNFSFAQSSGGTSYLQKARHLFAEMESIAMQFALFAENGELDRELMAVTPDGVLYKTLPSMLHGKYIYANEGSGEIGGVLNAMFSDQSGLTYLSKELRADSAAQLLIQNAVSYSDFAEHQKPTIGWLISLDVLTDTGSRVEIANKEQFLILRSLFVTQAASYYHLSSEGRAEADLMLDRGWVTRSASLLSEAEASYFNYYLNKVEFSNGPELRNKYLHGSQANGDGEDAHFQTFMTALKLTIALVIKLNDEFCLATAEGLRSDVAGGDGRAT